MQPLKITIEGDFLDSQIYSGLLYLWDYNGTIKTINFEKLVMSLVEKEEDLFSFFCAFLDGRYLYKSGISNLMADSEFKSLILKKLKRVSNRKLLVTKKQLDKFLVGEQEYAGKLMHIDSEIYSNSLYLSNEDGLFYFYIRRNTKYPVSTRAHKIWDLPVLSINASRYSQFALSGGSEGLFELNKSRLKYYNLKEVENSIFEITNEHSNYADYNSLSLFNTSFLGNSSLYQFEWSRKENEESKKRIGKVFKKNYKAEDIFESNGKATAWGSNDKIYYFSDGKIKVAKYIDSSESDSIDEFSNPFKVIATHEYDKKSGNAVFGKNAFFGVIVEFDNSLSVFKSNNEINIIKGPVSRWRTFPRSRNYENHLHVIKEASLEVYSFYHDFLSRQEEKIFGINSNLYMIDYDQDDFVSASERFKKSEG